MATQLFSRRNRARQHGFALLTSLVFLTVLLLLGSVLVEQSIQELNTASKLRKDTQAFNLAEAGIDYAAWQLYNAGPGLSLPATWSRTDLAAGTFTVTATQYAGSSDTLVLDATGAADGHQAEVKVVGNFLTTGPTDQNAVFDYGLFSNSDLTMGGSFSITGAVHANGNVRVNGNPTVTGDVSAVGTVGGSRNFGGQVLPRSDRVGMPVIDLQYYRSRALQILPGGTNFSGNTPLDGIVFVDGNCSINGNFSGQGVIVCSGQVTINGNAGLVNPASDEFAIVSAGGVRINGNCTIRGWIYTHNLSLTASFSGNGNATVTGGVAADVINKSNGNLTISYREPTVELPGAEAAPAQFDAVSWRRVR